MTLFTLATLYLAMAYAFIYNKDQENADLQYEILLKGVLIPQLPSSASESFDSETSDASTVKIGENKR